MKDSHLTLRLSADLARALARWARARGVPKSQVAREAVARYLEPGVPGVPGVPGGPTVRPSGLTAGGLAQRWGSLPRLLPAEAADLATDIAKARDALPPVGTPWA